MGKPQWGLQRPPSLQSGSGDGPVVPDIAHHRAAAGKLRGRRREREKAGEPHLILGSELIVFLSFYFRYRVLFYLLLVQFFQ